MNDSPAISGKADPFLIFLQPDTYLPLLCSLICHPAKATEGSSCNISFSRPAMSQAICMTHTACHAILGTPWDRKVLFYKLGSQNSLKPGLGFVRIQWTLSTGLGLDFLTLCLLDLQGTFHPESEIPSASCSTATADFFCAVLVRKGGTSALTPGTDAAFPAPLETEDRQRRTEDWDLGCKPLEGGALETSQSLWGWASDGVCSINTYWMAVAPVRRFIERILLETC